VRDVVDDRAVGMQNICRVGKPLAPCPRLLGSFKTWARFALPTLRTTQSKAKSPPIARRAFHFNCCCLTEQQEQNDQRNRDTNEPEKNGHVIFPFVVRITTIFAISSIDACCPRCRHADRHLRSQPGSRRTHQAAAKPSARRPARPWLCGPHRGSPWLR
jgi:hypothetical protein